MKRQAGLLDLEQSLEALSAAGDPLEHLERTVSFERFRPLLFGVFRRSGLSKVSCAGFDAVPKFRMLVLQGLCGLSLPQTSFPVRDRLRGLWFCGLRRGDGGPDANRLWDFREALIKAGALERLFQTLDQAISDAGDLAMGGQIIDATLVAAPRQRNSDGEKKAVPAKHHGQHGLHHEALVLAGENEPRLNPERRRRGQTPSENTPKHPGNISSDHAQAKTRPCRPFRNVRNQVSGGVQLYLFVAIDRTSKFAFVQLVEKATRTTASAFIAALIKAVPYKIHTVLTDNGIQFRYPPRYANGPTARAMTHMVDRRCRENGIQHRITKINHPWTNGQVERMNRTIKDATVKRFHYESHDQLRKHLQDFIDAYNFARRLKTLKTLKGLTPYEFIRKQWTLEPGRFIINPIHKMPGLNI